MNFIIDYHASEWHCIANHHKGMKIKNVKMRQSV